MRRLFSSLSEREKKVVHDNVAMYIKSDGGYEKCWNATVLSDKYSLSVATIYSIVQTIRRERGISVQRVRERRGDSSIKLVVRILKDACERQGLVAKITIKPA